MASIQRSDDDPGADHVGPEHVTSGQARVHGAPASTPTNDVARHLRDLAQDMEAQPGIEEVLDGIVAAAVRLIPNASEASISLVRDRRTMESFSASSELPRSIDNVQSAVQEGPCLDAAFDEPIVRVPDLGKEVRWPLFAERAWDLGARSMLSFQLFVDGDNLGALNVYGNTVGAFEDADEQIGQLVASHAAIAFADAQNLGRLNASLINQEIVGQAKGILMERYKISSAQAFTLIDAVSTKTSMKLIDVAENIVAGGAPTFTDEAHPLPLPDDATPETPGP